jgi:hypothetical protein
VASTPASSSPLALLPQDNGERIEDLKLILGRVAEVRAARTRALFSCAHLLSAFKLRMPELCRLASARPRMRFPAALSMPNPRAQSSSLGASPRLLCVAFATGRSVLHCTPSNRRPLKVATLFDDDGILVRFMNSPVEGNGIRSAADASALLGQVNGEGRWRRRGAVGGQCRRLPTWCAAFEGRGAVRGTSHLKEAAAVWAGGVTASCVPHHAWVGASLHLP